MSISVQCPLCRGHKKTPLDGEADSLPLETIDCHHCDGDGFVPFATVRPFRRATGTAAVARPPDHGR
ncbi:hypothetical protein LX16_4838 [Stackebrandtia albiflava]|uniref:Uncharacterized protein n=1 Tax=Stackebrandtia albiflava TaxID=406432 RepID=A0A562UPY5_9ACTN|nr:hypothetical protein [Stackebrandtia albiflava]TWJ07679.1 hypothetical protein LX16_4838 [Stackebrandtia albiflava]